MLGRHRSQRILPPIAMVVPLFVLFQQVGLLDTQLAIAITYVVANLPIAVWLMRDYFATVPLELEESAAVDGASAYRIFRSIVLPVSLPGLVATFLFVLVFAWNEYLLAVFLTGADTRTMPLLGQGRGRGPRLCPPRFAGATARSARCAHASCGPEATPGRQDEGPDARPTAP